MNNAFFEIATLGPKGTDSSYTAKLIKNKLKSVSGIHLFSTFNDAYLYAVKHYGAFLIPSAYISYDQDQISDTWADFNFKISIDNILRLWKVFNIKLQPLCLAKRKNAMTPSSISLHPSTRYYLSQIDQSISNCVFVNNKPIAVENCSSGLTDMCIGSESIIKLYDNLEIIKTYQSNMCWTLYLHKDKN